MAFHSYTRLIQKLFNAYWFGPPSRVTGTSPWPSVDHLVSRLPTPTQRPIQARSHCGCARPRAYPRRRRQLVGSLCKRHAVTRTRRAPTACGRMVSGSVSTSSAECFSPFPHGTGTLSVSRECLALPDGPGGFRRDYTCPALLRMPRGEGGLRLRGYHPLRRRFPGGLASSLYRRKRGPTTPGTPEDGPRFGLLPFRSPLLGESLDYFLFLRVLRCFSSPRSPPRQKNGDTGKAGGLSHSETRGSKATCAYPRIIAACHVLHRLREPRHPPCALELLPRHPPKGGRRSTCVLACADCQRSIAASNGGVENNGFEPLTPCLQSRCSSQLS